MIKNLIFSTGNVHKFQEAQAVMSRFDIELKQVKISIDEIQSDSFKEIALDKAKKSYELIKKPLFVNDSSWIFSATKGFPGPFMKYMNQWLTPEDFINLMSGHNNREVILQEIVVFTDGIITKIFKKEIKGQILRQPKGEVGSASDKIISFSPVGKSISEIYDSNTIEHESDSVWKDLAFWFSQK